jgi:hypothetical protein
MLDIIDFIILTPQNKNFCVIVLSLQYYNK